MKAQSSSPQGPDLAVVVPVLNEAENIEPLVGEIRSALDGRVSYEIVYVDDGSGDETPEILKRTAASLPQFRYVRHRVRCGQSTAMLTGVRSARAAWVATLDGDGQNDPADIPRLYERLLAHEGNNEGLLVVGYRRKRRDSWLKKISSRVANSVRSRLLKDETPDTGSGLKLFNRRLFLQLPYFDHMHRFLPALVIRHGGRVVSVEVNHRERKHGDSKYGLRNRLWVGIVDMLGVMWLQRRAKVPDIEVKG
ncbi:MAG: glycosyltransferase family 2 protein [Deltaproteobacteria bacterium]|nr:glycosyltransferase family 2 protein [Deltaproteobacteria bacterium]